MNNDLLYISKLRFNSQQLYGTSITTGQKMVEWFGAIQGQEYTQTKWSLGLRLNDSDDRSIEKELSEGRILRTHLLRPTWHFVSSEDIHWMLMLTARRINLANAYMYRKLELDTPLFNRCNDIIISMLEGGKQLTRDEINAEFRRNNILAEGHRLSYIMMRSELDGITCSGIRRGKQFTYALLDERVDKRKTKTREEALTELTRRYLQSRGPATIKDFSTWSGLTLSECKSGIEIAKPSLESLKINDEIYYWYPETRQNNSPDIYLLPLYDEIIMGYKNRNAFFELRNKIKPAPEFRFNCMIANQHQIIGSWNRITGHKKPALQYDFFIPLDELQEKMLEKSAIRFNNFYVPDNKSGIVSSQI